MELSTQKQLYVDKIHHIKNVIKNQACTIKIYPILLIILHNMATLFG